MTTPRTTARTTAPKRKPKPAPEPEQTVDLDLDDLTMDEAEMLEEVLDMGIDEIAERLQVPGPKVRIFRALLWLHKRRTDPTLTFDDVKHLRVGQIGGGDPKPRNDAPAV